MNIVDGRDITIDRQGAQWAYGLGFWHKSDGCPFYLNTPHAHFWMLGARGHRFQYVGDNA